MAIGWIELRGRDVFCSAPDIGAESRFPIDDACARLADWALRYDRVSSGDDKDELLALGREMFNWLDEAGWASAWSLAAGDRVLEIRVEARSSEEATLLLDAPWELMGNDQGPLAADALQLFVVSRRIGVSGDPWRPSHGDINLMFMAASVEGQSVLAFEDEEAAILEATGGKRMHLIVEETGALDPLGERLTSDEGPFEVLHLSCHGTLDRQKGPVLLLETIEGDADIAGPGDLVEAFGPLPPALVVLSACRTAERGGLAAPFARQLATMIANVVGWDGSVYDRDATDFAAEFYTELERRSSVPRAAAHGRRALLRIQAENPRRGLHWHLARVYLGPGGGGPLCEAGKQLRRRAADMTPHAFLDKTRKRVPVASREAFVGRRRALQAILRAFRDGTPALLHGMGAVGKSSAAARIANRLSMATCVIFESYDALAIFDALIEMLPPVARQNQRDTWRNAVLGDAWALADALETWLAGPFDAAPILLIVDDLERVLEAPAPGDLLTGVKPDYRAPIGAILKAFGSTRSASRLLMTSRYDFTLPDGRGGDLAGDLFRQPLVAMPQNERQKQLRAAGRIAGREDLAAQAGPLIGQALNLAGGNPGLQEALTKPIIAGELDVAEKALAMITEYRRTGVPPEEIQAMIDAGTAADSDNATIAFFARISMQTYRDALTDDEVRQLSAATLFSEGMPIPLSAVVAAGAANGCAEPERAIQRLLGLGLLEDWGSLEDQQNLTANALARPLVPALDAAQTAALADAALPHLAAAWRDYDGGFVADARGAEAARLAFACPDDHARLEAAVFAGASWLARVMNRPREAMALIARAHESLPADYPGDAGFLRLGVECADILSETAMVNALLSRPRRQPAGGEPWEVTRVAQLDLRHGEQLVKADALDRAETLTRSALAQFEESREEVLAAKARGQLADIEFKRGNSKEAFHIWEEQMEVFKLGNDTEAQAHALNRMSEMMTETGDKAEALRIQREEALPLLRKTRNRRELSISLQSIALQILQKDDVTAEEMLESFECIRESYEIAVELELPDGIAYTGRLFADGLHAIGYRKEAVDVLGNVKRAFEYLGRLPEAEETQSTIEEILSEMSPDG